MTIQVSVVCHTYNQEKYIAQTLDSILEQRTSFNYEIIIHDDASTDQTQSIVKEYARKYSEKITLIQQSINQYSQGNDIEKPVNEKIRGDFVALCEGDDYWISQDKLQLQYDYMRNHPDCSLCVHGAERYSDTHKAVIGYICPSNYDRDFSIEEIIEEGGGLFATNSMMFKREYYYRPELFRGWGIGDYPYCIYLALNGRVHYIALILSAYRVMSENSWTSKMSKNADLALKSYNIVTAHLQEVDRATRGKYSESIKKYMTKDRHSIRVATGDWRGVLSEDNIEYYSSLNASTKIKDWLRCVHPLLFRKLSDAKIRASLCLRKHTR